jgi:hypothetical protein
MLCCLDSVSVDGRAIIVVFVEVRFRFKSRSGRGQWDIIMSFQVEVSGVSLVLCDGTAHRRKERTPKDIDYSLSKILS